MNFPANIDSLDIDLFWSLCNKAYEFWCFQKALETNERKDDLLVDPWLRPALTTINDALIDHTLLQIAKLHDPPTSRTRNGIVRDNLSIAFIASKSWPEPFQQQINEIKSGLDHSAAHLTDARRWLLAHNDRETLRKNLTLGECDPSTYEIYFEYLQRFVNVLDSATGGAGVRPFVQISGHDMAGLISTLIRGRQD